MKINQLQYFIEVVENNNNITRAAQNLYISQPAISLAIRELEEEFDTTLFIRNNNQLKLTDEGNYLYQIGKELIEKYDETLEKMNSFVQDSQYLKISIPPMLGSFIIPQFVTEYTKMHPTVQLQITELGSLASHNAVSKNEMSLGITVIKDEQELNPNLEYIELLETNLLFVVNKNHPLAKHETVSPLDIGSTPLIVMKDDCLQSSLINDYFNRFKVRPNIKIRSNQLYTIKELINNTDMCGFIFEQVLKQNDDLVGIKVETPLKLKICLIWNKEVSQNEVTEGFLNFMKSMYKKG